MQKYVITREYERNTEYLTAMFDWLTIPPPAFNEFKRQAYFERLASFDTPMDAAKFLVQAFEAKVFFKNGEKHFAPHVSQISIKAW